MIASEMGSEGWAVFGRSKEVNGKIIENYKMLASHLSEKEAKLLASSDTMLDLLERLERWEKYIGRWEAPIWREVEQFLEEINNVST